MFKRKKKNKLRNPKNASRNKLYFFAAFIVGLFIISAYLFESFFSQDHKFFRLHDESLKESVEISKGDTLYHILSPYDISFMEVKKMVQHAKPYINLSNLKIGQKWNIYSKEENGKKIFQNLQINISKDKWLKIKKGQNNKYNIQEIIKPILKKYVHYSVPIDSTLLQSALDHNVPYKNVMQSINAHSYDIDFQRDVKKGSHYDVIVEKFIDPTDNIEEYGRTIYSAVKLKNKNHQIYLTKLKNGKFAYANPNCTTVKKSLLKTPVQATRISSRYGMRKHPVLGYSRMHTGIDFAAPPGTPVYAAGDGKIVSLGRRGGYGRYIKIKHNSRISTAYAHLLSYAKGLKKGKKVKQGQIIGKVGASGRATGPHLHYEVLINGRHVNPLSVKSQPSRKLNNKEKGHLTNIKNLISKILEKPENISNNLNSQLVKLYE